MDAALLKERELFKKRALAQPSIEKKVRKDEPANKKAKLPHKAKPNWSSPSPAPALDFRTATPTSSHKFSILHRVIEYLKKRHHRGDNYPLSLEDLLDEAKMTDMNQKHRLWLSSEALLKNAKVDVIDGNMFKFKPSLPISTRKELLVHLKKMERRGLGGIYEEQVEEALPEAKKHIDKLLELGKIIVLQRSDKKRVLHFKDTGTDSEYTVDDEFVKLWRSVAVDGIDDKTIDDYLQKQGISSMEHVGLRRVAQPKRKGSRKGKNFKKLNDHLNGVLEDYSEKK
ncbi:general transcription factor IIE subunit 2-like [Watersipora subatra]|uniref:general transcription factor IIE subunit 2-like n=1 Tax=Watersipora subatra TaxID=2589382 RepID=UPI00355AD651